MRSAAGHKRVEELEQTVVDLRAKVLKSDAEKINLVKAMMAEEQGMLEAFRKLDDARKAAQQQLHGALEMAQRLDRENQSLAASLTQEQEKAYIVIGGAVELYAHRPPARPLETT